MDDHLRPTPYKRARLQQGIDAKIVVMGNTGVGKTSLLHRYTQNRFDPKTTTSTTGAFFVTKKIDVNGTKVRLQLWDTAGQERFRSMAPMYYRGANAALLLYDITNLNSFQDIRGWLEELKRNCSSDLLIYIVGAKADLYQQRQVTSDLARLSLHNWFPPPKPPTPPPAPSPVSPFGFRPRFTSFTSIRSLPAIPSNTALLSPEHAAVTEPPILLPQQPGCARATALQRAKTNALPRSRTTTALPLGRSKSVMSPSRFGSPASWNDAVNGSNTSLKEAECEGDEPEWGLGKGMELFEASAKEGDGIQQLFETLIGAIIQRKDAIEVENEMKKRDSVMLTTNTPSWAAEADEEQPKDKPRSIFGAWSCCSV